MVRLSCAGWGVGPLIEDEYAKLPPRNLVTSNVAPECLVYKVKTGEFGDVLVESTRTPSLESKGRSKLSGMSGRC